MFERYHGRASEPSQRISFLKENLIGAETTRIRNGEAIDFR
jgi:hypothetical protein